MEEFPFPGFGWVLAAGWDTYVFPTPGPGGVKHIPPHLGWYSSHSHTQCHPCRGPMAMASSQPFLLRQALL